MSNSLDPNVQFPAAPGGIPRPIEAVVALVGLAVCAPLMVLLIAVTRLTSRGPAVFRQIRIGRNGRPFVLYKLRTMKASPGGPQVTAGDDARITRLGRILRKTKLDEFPELWNVVKGDMSLVGPRPEVPAYIDLDNPRWRAVLSVRPGITDPVTMALRNEETLIAAFEGNREAFYINNLQPLKLKGYLSYLSSRSWLTDVAVILGTVVVVFCPQRVSLLTNFAFGSDCKEVVWSKETETLK
jgi:lipopolysaccharide/colanic/teichoic acid biosynthesis glycosyltransferase